MKTWKVIIGIGLIYILGILTGLLPGFYYRHKFPPPPLPPVRNNDHAVMMLERLARDLDLTEKQINQSKEILRDMDEKLGRHFRTAHSGAKEIFDDSFSQIEKILDNNQKKKFHYMRERMERERSMFERKMMSPPGKPPFP